MLTLGARCRVFVYRGSCDMRRSFEGLAYMVREYLKEDPLSGHLFLFFSRGRTSMKALVWDRSGFALYYKRLERGTFSVPEKLEISAAELQCVLEGIDLVGARRKVRYER